MSWYHNVNSPKGKRTAFPKVLINDIRNFPIKFVNNHIQETIVYLVKKITTLSKNLNNIIINFFNYATSKSNKTLSKNVFILHTLSSSAFLEELKKSKIKLTLSEEAEWMEYFNEQKAKALELKAEIDKTDKEIDQMVYELYGLTDEEIKIVEESTNN